MGKDEWAGPGRLAACLRSRKPVLQSKGIPAGRLLVVGAGNAGPLGQRRDRVYGGRPGGVGQPPHQCVRASGTRHVRAGGRSGGGSGRCCGWVRRLSAQLSRGYHRPACGRALLGNRGLRGPPAGRGELAAGQAGTRLLSAVGALAAPYHVDVTGFGAPAAGASPGGPLRSADISPTLRRRGRDAATLNSVKRFLLAEQTPFRPADVTTVRLASGQAVLHVECTAPSALGLLGALN